MYKLIVIVIVIFAFENNLGEQENKFQDIVKYVTHCRDNVNGSIDSKLIIAYGNVNTTKSEFQIEINTIKEQILYSNEECATPIKEILKQLEAQLITLENCAMKKEFEKERCTSMRYFNVILEKAKSYSEGCNQTVESSSEKADSLEKDLKLARQKAMKEISQIAADSKDCFETTTDIIKKGIDDVMIGWEACKE